MKILPEVYSCIFILILVFENKNIQALDLHSIFPESTPEIVLDLIDKLIVYNPLKRYSATEALQHPYFNS